MRGLFSGIFNLVKQTAKSILFITLRTTATVIETHPDLFETSS